MLPIESGLIGERDRTGKVLFAEFSWSKEKNTLARDRCHRFVVLLALRISDRRDAGVCEEQQLDVGLGSGKWLVDYSPGRKLYVATLENFGRRFNTEGFTG